MPRRVFEGIRQDPELAELVMGLPQRRGFTSLDQADLLLKARNDKPDFAMMHQVLALCALPRMNPGDQLQYRRENGWWTLTMSATGDAGLPFGPYPRLLLTRVCTEAIRTQGGRGSNTQESSLARNSLRAS